MKITVEVKEVWSHTVIVDVPDEQIEGFVSITGYSEEQRKGYIRQVALEAANQLIAEGDEGELEYNRTLDPDQWTVRDEKGNYFE